MCIKSRTAQPGLGGGDAGCWSGADLVLAAVAAAGVVAIRRVLDPALTPNFVSLAFALDEPDAHVRRGNLSVEPDDCELADYLSGQVLDIPRNFLGRRSFCLVMFSFRYIDVCLL